MTELDLADWTQGESRLVVLRCLQCGNRWYLPHEHCPVCGCPDVDRSAAGGGGLCVAVTRLHVTTSGRTDADRSLGLALVELDEGPLVMGRVHDEALAPGDRARVSFLPEPRDPEEPALVPSFAREGLT